MDEFPIFPKKYSRNLNKVDLVFPNKYYGGVYSLAMHIFYNLVNLQDKWYANRVYLDKGRLSSDLLGFTFQYELDYFNILDMVKRKSENKVVFAGGPVVNANPYVLKDVADFVVLGEAEETMAQVLENYDKNKRKFLKNIADLDGVYVFNESNKPKYRFIKKLDYVPYPIYQPLPLKLTKQFVFGNSFLLETDRGCVFQCKFCSLPHYYKRIKVRSLDNIKKIIDDGLKINRRKRVVIYSASFSHPKRKDILKYLVDKGVTFSVPSSRAEMLDKELVELIAKGGQKTLTLAPEADEDMRFSLGKLTKDELFFKIIDDANKSGIKKIKYYFMIGLPGQDEDSLKKSLMLMKKLQKQFKGQSYFSINVFVPKLNTRFRDHEFDAKKIKKQIGFLRKNLGDVRYKISSLRLAKKEYELGRLNHQED